MAQIHFLDLEIHHIDKQSFLFLDYQNKVRQLTDYLIGISKFNLIFYIYSSIPL